MRRIWIITALPVTAVWMADVIGITRALILKAAPLRRNMTLMDGTPCVAILIDPAYQLNDVRDAPYWVNAACVTVESLEIETPVEHEAMVRPDIFEFYPPVQEDTPPIRKPRPASKKARAKRTVRTGQGGASEAVRKHLDKHPDDLNRNSRDLAKQLGIGKSTIAVVQAKMKQEMTDASNGHVL